MAQDDRGGGVPIAPVLALLLFAGGMLIQHEPLQTERPPSNVEMHPIPGGGQVVEARLWQDPLGAAQLHRMRYSNPTDRVAQGLSARDCEDSTTNLDCHDANWLNREIGNAALPARESAGSEASAKVLIMPVMIFGGPYPEDAEDRRRTRYAVLSALFAEEYEPVNARGLGYVTLGNALPEMVPFEQFRMRHGKHPGLGASGATAPKSVANSENAVAPKFESVFVLYVTEETFRNTSPDNFANFLEQFVDPGNDNVTVRVLGPSSSSTFAKFNQGGIPTQCNPSYDNVTEQRACIELNGRAVQFLSPRLTAPVVGGKVVGNNFDPLRFSPDDGQLAQSLRAELVQRGLKIGGLCDPEVRIALVVEADTGYGRSLEEQFRTAMSCEGDDDLRVFRYFRGLDGKVAQSAEDVKKESKTQTGAPKQEFTEPQERAQGQSQFDYLLRIASSAEHEESKKHKPFRAVIVLGSDVYDKLAVLHAMKEKLPGAIFATTDMDAAFLQPNQTRWTRNLIVASGYGLRLTLARDKGVPPFRDTYQTATFLAATTALRHSADSQSDLNQFPFRQPHESWPQDSDRTDAKNNHDNDSVTKVFQARRNALTAPRLFEIGDDTFIRLKPQSEDLEGKDAPTQSIEDYVSLFGVGISLLLVAGVLSWCLRSWIWEHWRWFAIAAITVAAYIGYTMYLANRPGEEPIPPTLSGWVSGISAWPSEIIRFATIGLAILFYLRGRLRLKQGDARIEDEFFGETHHYDLASGRPKSSEGRDTPPSRWRSMFPRLCQEHESHGCVDVVALWREYQEWISPRCHYARTSIAALAYIAMIAFVGYSDPPLSPVRGTASRMLDFATEWTAVMAVVVLLVTTLDRVSIATLFLNRLYGGRDQPRISDWSPSVLQRFCNAECDAARNYVDLRLSARVSAAIGEIVLYPFVLLVLLLAARSKLFVNWTMHWPLFSLLMLVFALIVLAALSLRMIAERIRQEALARLTETEVRQRVAVIVPGQEPAPRVKMARTAKKECSADQLAMMRQVVTTTREGAFAPLTEQPIVRALILPFGGAGAMSLLEYLLMAKG